MGLHSPPFFCHYHAFIQSVIPDFTAQDRICPVDSSSRKAMNLDTIETVPSGDDCGLVGIGESSNTQVLFYKKRRAFTLLFPRDGYRKKSAPSPPTFFIDH